VTKGKRTNHKPRSESGVKGLRAKSVALVARVARGGRRVGIKGPENSLAIRSLGRPSARSISATSERFFLASQSASARGARRLNYIKDDVARTHTPKAFYKTRVSGVASFLFLMYERAPSFPHPAVRLLPKSTTNHNSQLAPCQKVEQTDAEKRLNWN
jgi:hypothetical protein